MVYSGGGKKGLTDDDWLLSIVTLGPDTCSLRTLAEWHDCSKANASRWVNRLRDRGLVEQDRPIRLTGPGALVEKGYRAVHNQPR